ncbi:MAG TPA: leucine-rich repeat domain-containing protein [Anaerolineaceae bacterium]|nr:leucine-rich repeat domain-containing protein [Anaerolineaceae bacterium]HPS32638.1 leucine-rich repeat domain-containing protein [Anaerolineaceae bacterium]
MKKTLFVSLILILALNLSGCSAPAAQQTAIAEQTRSAPLVTPEPGEETAAEPVILFADPVLEGMIRGAMGKPDGSISAEEAQAVTRMDFSNAWSQHLPQDTLIHALGGLEAFTNLESLDLSDQAISDISVIQGLTKLTYLSLANNPVSDVSPLAELTNLKVLILSKSQAQDYSALASLVNLQVLLLDNSTITDLTPLSDLTNLNTLYLANAPAEDLSPIENIYPALAKKDFKIPSTLVDLGFSMDHNNHEAIFDSEEASFTINHEAWGMPSREDNLNIVRMSLYLNGENKASIGYYGIHKVYVCQMVKEGQPQVNYLYNPVDGSFNISPEDRPNAEQMIRAALDVMDGEDALFAPIRFYNDTIQKTFHMTAAALYALPFEPPTLKSLGFFPDKPNAVCFYEQRGERDYNLEIHRPEWGEKEYDVRFFTPLSNDYRIVITYNINEKKFNVGVDDNFGGGGSFEFSSDTKNHVDLWCSDQEMTVEEYFIKAYDDPAIEDVYLHSIEMMRQYFIERFGLTMEELFSLPGCE